jgi:hypothetical protein
MISPEADLQANIEMVRPATMQSLTAHLERHPRGYFALIQFDVHGVEDVHGRSVPARKAPRSPTARADVSTEAISDSSEHVLTKQGHL